MPSGRRPPLFISKDEVLRLLPMDTCIALMEEALLALGTGKAVQPLRSVMRLPDTSGLLGMMPSWSADARMIGIKVISVFPHNRASGLSSHQGAVLLFDGGNGTLKAVVDADAITAIRTAAVSALATKILARNSVAALAILGSGTQARMHAEAMLCVRSISSVKVWSR